MFMCITCLHYSLFYHYCTPIYNNILFIYLFILFLYFLHFVFILDSHFYLCDRLFLRICMSIIGGSLRTTTAGDCFTIIAAHMTIKTLSLNLMLIWWRQRDGSVLPLLSPFSFSSLFFSLLALRQCSEHIKEEKTNTQEIDTHFITWIVLLKLSRF